MKISIMTLSMSPNYGAQLQSYALAKKISDLGADVEVYRYFDKRRITYGMPAAAKIKYHVWNGVKKILFGSKKEAGFKQFREKYVPMSSQTYRNNKELKDNPGDYDVFIAGSDQIWNPKIFKYDLSYFLDFVSENRKKISYASSFASKSFSSEYKERCAALLGEFDHISVRETSGAEIIKELCGKRAEVVLDPTLLLTMDDWRYITKTASEKSKGFSGILCYIMPGDKKVTDAMETIAQKLKKETGLPIMRLGIKEYDTFKYPKDEYDTKADPCDFVSYFMGAEYVVTNSFHGTAFSVNFGKKLIVPYNPALKDKSALHERMVSLLDIVELSGVLWPAGEEFKEYKTQDITRATELLTEQRNKSLSYLKTALGV